MNSVLPPSVFSLLVKDALDAVLIISSRGTICYLNRAFESLSGYSSDGLVGASMNRLLPDAVGRVHDAYLLDYLSAERSSTVLGKVREMQLRHRCGELIPVEIKAIDLGVVDGCRYFGAFISDLRFRKRLEATNDGLLAQLHHLALTDALTELPNRRAFEGMAGRLFALAERENFDLCVGIADLDRFKTINDRYGHLAGDQVLKAAAATFQENLRAGDFIARTGGEEFGLLFPSVTLNAAAGIAERLRHAVEATPVYANGSGISVTVSIGVAQLAPHESVEEAMARADRGLYRAKEKGRNRVEAIPASSSDQSNSISMPCS